jgi:hypothetical protein
MNRNVASFGLSGTANVVTSWNVRPSFDETSVAVSPEAPGAVL